MPIKPSYTTCMSSVRTPHSFLLPEVVVCSSYYLLSLARMTLIIEWHQIFPAILLAKYFLLPCCLRLIAYRTIYDIGHKILFTLVFTRRTRERRCPIKVCHAHAMRVVYKNHFFLYLCCSIACCNTLLDFLVNRTSPAFFEKEIW